MDGTILQTYNKQEEAEKYLIVGKKYLEDDKYEDAVGSFDKVLALNANFLEALCYKGWSLCYLSEFNDSIKCLEIAINLDNNNPKPFFLKAFSLACAGNKSDAQYFFEEGNKRVSNDAEVIYLKAIVLANINKYEEALTEYNKAITLKPGCARIYRSKGITLVYLGRYEEAIACFDSAILLKPNFVLSFLNKGFALNELRKSEEAIICFDTVIKFKPDYAQAYYGKGFALNELRKSEEARTCFDIAIKIKPDYDNAYNMKGVIYFEQKKYIKALAQYNKSIEKSTFTLINKAIVLVLLTKYNAALKILKETTVNRKNDKSERIQYEFFVNLVKGFISNRKGKYIIALEAMFKAYSLIEVAKIRTSFILSLEYREWLVKILIFRIELSQKKLETNNIKKQLNELGIKCEYNLIDLNNQKMNLLLLQIDQLLAESIIYKKPTCIYA